MAFVLGDSCVLAAALVTPAISTPGLIADGNVDFLAFGMNIGGGLTLWNTGEVFNANPNLLRRVLPGSSVDIVGKCVQVTGKSTYYRGLVIAAIQLEIGTTGGTGPETDCVYVLGNGGSYFLALLSSVEEVSC